jgi:type VI protein secretion system component VasK
LKKPLLLKILSWFVLVPLGAAMVVFSVVNRHAVTLDFWPFDYAPEIRLFAVILGLLTVGVVWGGIAAWLAASASRRRSRDAKHRANAAEADARQLKDRIGRLKADLRAAQSVPTAAPFAPPTSAPSVTSEGGGTAQRALPPADAA